MLASDFKYVRDLVRDESANLFENAKQPIIEIKLQRIAEREGLRDVDDLVAALRRFQPGLRHTVVEALTNNETLFFRDVHPFTALRDVVIPDVLRGGDGRLRVWSAAASTGQEAYSVAMLLREHFDGVGAEILGTDLSPAAIDAARTARYSTLEVNRGLPAALLVRYFAKHGDHWQLRDRIRLMVDFKVLNLCNPTVDFPVVDLVMLRNVLIYFEPRARIRLLERIASSMRPGGYLLLGSAESTLDVGGLFEREQIGKASFFRVA